MSDDWKKECAVTDTGTYKYYMYSRNAGRAVGVLSMLKVWPKMKAVVPDLESLDRLVRAGVQPSQVIVTSEIKNTWSAEAISSALWKGES